MSFTPKLDDADLPSYNEVVAGGQSSPIRATIQDELLNLSVQFRCIQGQKLAQLARADEEALNLILPHIKNFLADYSETTLPRATLILVPSDAVSPTAMPADDDLRKADDFGRVVMVSSEKGGKRLAWSGEAMTGRLARNFSPRPTEIPEQIPEQIIEPYLTEVTATKPTLSPTRSFWKRKPTSPPENVFMVPRKVEKSPQALPKVAMDVKAEEIVFRMENDMGLYETARVWGIVVKVHVGGVAAGYRG